MVTIDPGPADSNAYEVNVIENMSDHVLATGPRYEFKDIRFTPANYLWKNTSGVAGKKTLFQKS